MQFLKFLNFFKNRILSQKMTKKNSYSNLSDTLYIHDFFVKIRLDLAEKKY